MRVGLAVCFISGLVLALAPLHSYFNVTTIGFALLLGVLFVSIHMGGRVALVACVIATIGYNFFFLPPIGTLTIQDPQNWVALVAFSATALVAGKLSADARARAIEAERSRRELERLYQELQAAFEVSSQAEAIKRSERMKSAILDAVTHDLRTPLTSIRAAATTLRKADCGGEQMGEELQSELIALVDEESMHLDQLISSFVELARVEAGHLSLKATWSSFQDITFAAIKRVQRQMNSHKIQVEVPDTLPMMHIDARALSEVIYTLLDNARKYSPQGSLITVRAVAQHGGIQVSVEDDGPGIAEKDAASVFQKFYRGEETRSSAPGGLGVGLAIAKSIVEAHGGTIWVGREPARRGTTMMFRIPFGEGHR